MPTPPAATQEKILQTYVDELRRKYDQLNTAYDQLRVKVLAFITGELALVAYLFATDMKLPHLIYGIVFFLVGSGCIAASFVALIYSLRSSTWELPIDNVLLEEPDYSIFPNQVANLEYICKCYTSALEKNNPKYQKRAKLFDISLMLLLTGVIILLVIKFGQGAVLWHNVIQN